MLEAVVFLVFIGVLVWAFAKPGQKAPERAAAPKRVICIAPSITETVFAIGAGSRVVGVDDFSDWPPEVKDIPRVGGFINPNFERLLTLKPDLVIVQGFSKKVSDFCEANGIGLLRIDMDASEGVYRSIRDIGAAVGASRGAKALEERIRASLKETAEKVDGRGRPKVFFLVGYQQGTLSQLMTIGRDSFLHGLIETAGAENVFGDIAVAYPTISKESLIKRAPEIIIHAHPGRGMTEAARKQVLDEWRAFTTVPAVRDNRVIILTDDFILKPGPRIDKITRRLAKVIHPEAFGAKRDTR